MFIIYNHLVLLHYSQCIKDNNWLFYCREGTLVVDLLNWLKKDPFELLREPEIQEVQFL